MLAIAIACYRYRYVLEYVHVCTRVVLEYCNTYSVCHSIPVYSSMSILVYTRVHVYRYRYRYRLIVGGIYSTGTVWSNEIIAICDSMKLYLEPVRQSIINNQ